VQPRNHQQLYEALVALLSDTRLALHLGQAGRRIVEERYSAVSMIRKYLSLFESTLQPK
jgi:glycosyltransferase involved in cell wall biosynthesis